jgi:hypothetical protein
MKKKGRNKRTNHHILPSSRGGSDDNQNIAKVPDKKHRSYHHLFFNLTPDEIIKELVENYWNGQWEWVKIALQEMEKY